MDDLSVRAGDPFAYAGQVKPKRQDESHGCYEGWVYLGFEMEEDGELIEVTDRVRCRRCEREES